MKNTFAYIEDGAIAYIAVPRWLRDILREQSLKKGQSIGKLVTEELKKSLSPERALEVDKKV